MQAPFDTAYNKEHRLHIPTFVLQSRQLGSEQG